MKTKTPKSDSGVPLGSLVEPGAKAAIDAAAAGKVDFIIMQVVGFQTDAEAVILMHMLWYAWSQGAGVRFISPQERTK